MKIALYGRPFKKGFDESISSLVRLMDENRIEIIVHRPFYDFLRNESKINITATGFFENHEDILGNADFVFSIGGDGTFLEAVTIVQDYGIPIVGINTGRLGFLANISPDEIETSFMAILNGEYRLEERSLVKLEPGGHKLEGFPFALNEISIQKRFSTMISIHTYLDDRYMNSYWADGLIISTPTGSTAYSLSVGGPILTPDSNNLIISPLAPHNLTIRPLVVPGNTVLRMKVESREDNFILTLDRRKEILTSGIELSIRKADFSIKTLRIENTTFYDTLRNKLLWGIDKRN